MSSSSSLLIELIPTLTAEQQAAVQKFIRYLKQQEASTIPVSPHAAFEEFVRDHAELLKRLAQ